MWLSGSLNDTTHVRHTEQCLIHEKHLANTHYCCFIVLAKRKKILQTLWNLADHWHTTRYFTYVNSKTYKHWENFRNSKFSTASTSLRMSEISNLTEKISFRMSPKHNVLISFCDFKCDTEMVFLENPQEWKWSHLYPGWGAPEEQKL